MMEIGTVNNLEVTLGQRGQGKSTYQCARARQLCQEFGGAYVIGHSLGGRLPKSLPAAFGGGELPISYHPTLKELNRELHRHPSRWHILAPPIARTDQAAQERQTCDDLIRYSMDLSQAIRDRAYRKAHPEVMFKIGGKRRIRDYNGLPATPIIMIVDEGVAIEAASSGQKSKGQDRWFLEWIYSLRHLHTALLYAIQNPTTRNWQLLSESTRVTVFRTKHEWALNAIRAAGGTKYEMQIASHLDKHEYIILNEDEGPDEDAELEESDDVREPDERELESAQADESPSTAPTMPEPPVSSPGETKVETPPAV